MSDPLQSAFGFLMKPLEKKNGSAGSCPRGRGYFCAVWPFTHAHTDFRSVKIRAFGKLLSGSGFF